MCSKLDSSDIVINSNGDSIDIAWCYKSFPCCHDVKINNEKSILGAEQCLELLKNCEYKNNENIKKHISHFDNQDLNKIFKKQK
jgi:hypothetical protein